MNDAGLAVADLTHGIAVAGLPVPGLSFGTDMAGIFGLIGSSYSLVTVDGRRATSANPLGLQSNCGRSVRAGPIPLGPG